MSNVIIHKNRKVTIGKGKNKMKKKKRNEKRDETKKEKDTKLKKKRKKKLKEEMKISEKSVLVCNKPIQARYPFKLLNTKKEIGVGEFSYCSIFF